MRTKVILAVILALGLSVLCLADTKGRMDVNVGDEIYVCGCGEGCPCDTMSMKAGNCTCGKELVKTKVTKVDNDYIYVESRAKGFKRVGKYACACGEACKCGTISQNPGKCACGVEMKEVKAN